MSSFKMTVMVAPFDVIIILTNIRGLNVQRFTSSLKSVCTAVWGTWKQIVQHTEGQTDKRMDRKTYKDTNSSTGVQCCNTCKKIIEPLCMKQGSF